jgi:hypothetical protein
MSRRELTAWLGFLGAVAGCLYLGWLLFPGWPGREAFDDSMASPVFTGATVYLFVITGLLAWRRNETLADERDRAIDGDAAKHGFYALIVLNMIGGVAMHAKPALVSQLGPEWLRFCLIWMTLVSLAVFGGSQLYRYRRG